MISSLVLALIPISVPLHFQDEAPKPLPAQSRPAPAEWQKAAAKANKLAGEKKFAEAADAFASVFEMKDFPEASRPNLALTTAWAYGKAGNKEKAADYMAKALDGGFYDYEALAGDEDMKAIMSEEKVKEAMKRNATKKAAFDAERKKAMDEANKKKQVEIMEKLKDPNGAGFDFTFNLKDLDGKVVSSDSIKGKVAIVDIWGTWCPPCRKEIPHFIDLVKKHNKGDFVMIGLNDEHTEDHINGEKEAETARKFAKENGINYQLAMIDEATIMQVPKFRGYPTTLFFDKKGKVRFVEVGYTAFENLDTIVTALLAEK
ncbi:MAG: TlpA family protein disulfide reductase [Planctomycetota bacterium]